MKTKLTLLLSFLLCLACNKDKNQTPTPITPPENLGVISTSLTDINSHQFVLLTVKNVELTDSIYSGTFGGKELSLYKSSDTSLVFLTPDLATGKHILKMEKAGNSMEFNVTQTVLDDTPENIVLAFNEKSLKIFNDLKANTQEGMGGYAYKNEINKLYDDYLAKVNTFKNGSAEDKINEAKIVKANEIYFKFIWEAFEKINTLKGGRVNQIQANAPQARDETNSLYEVVFPYGVSAVITFAGFYIGKKNPITGFFVIVGGLAIFFNIAAKQQDTASELLSSQQWTGNVQERLMAQTFKNYQENPAKMNILKTTLQRNGAKEGGKDWVKKYFLITDRLNSILEAAKLPLIQTPLLSGEVSSENADLLQLSIDNPKVTGQITGTQNNYQVKFSTSEKESQDFNYKIIYDDTEFKVESPLYPATLEVSGGKPVITSITSEITTSTNQYGQTFYSYWVVIEYEDEDGDMADASKDPSISFCSWYPEKNYTWCGPSRTVDNPDPHKGKFRDHKSTAEGSTANLNRGQKGTWKYTIFDKKGNESEPAYINIQ